MSTFVIERKLRHDHPIHCQLIADVLNILDFCSVAVLNNFSGGIDLMGTATRKFMYHGPTSELVRTTHGG